MLRRITITILLLHLTVHFCKANHYTDSLKNELEKGGLSDKKKAIVYGDLAWEYSFMNLDSAFMYANLELQLSEKINFTAQYCDALNTLGMIARYKGDFRSSLNYYQTCLKQYYKTKDTVSIAAIYNNIGIIYQYQKNYKLALKYLYDGLKFYSAKKNALGIANSYNNIGLTYAYLKDFDNAEKYYDSTIRIKKNIKEDRGLSNAYINLGTLFWDQKKYAAAEAEFEKALDFAKKIDDSRAYYVSLGNIGQAKIKRGKTEEGIQNCEEAYHFASENELTDILYTCYDCLYKGYKSKGDLKNTLFFLEKYLAQKDSNQNQQLTSEIAMKEAQFEYSLKFSEDSIQNAQQNKLNKAELLAADAELEKKQFQQYVLYGGLILVLLFAAFVYNRFRISQKQKSIIEEKEKETHLQKQIIEEKQKEIIDSINYAQRLQQAILTPESEIQKYFPEGFLFYKPKDIVAGDFYFFEVTEDTIFYAAADCTGHGVPGAMMSIVCSNALTRCVKEFKLKDPGKILDKTRELVLETFEKSQNDVKDGMDISLISIDKKSNEIKWAGANNPLWYIENGVMKEISADKQPIGKSHELKPFTTQILPLALSTLFLFTDGYADQFGGPKGKKFKYSSLKKLLTEMSHEESNVINEKLETVFSEWKGDLEQVDDICIIGIRI